MENSKSVNQQTLRASSSPNIEFEKFVSPSVVKVNNTLTYKLYFHNESDIRLTDVTFLDTLAIYFQAVSNSLIIDGNNYDITKLSTGINFGAVNPYVTIPIEFKVKLIFIPTNGCIVGNPGTMTYTYNNQGTITTESVVSTEANIFLSSICGATGKTGPTGPCCIYSTIYGDFALRCCCFKTTKGALPLRVITSNGPTVSSASNFKEISLSSNKLYKVCWSIMECFHESLRICH